MTHLTKVLPWAILTIVLCLGCLMKWSINYPFWQPLEQRTPVKTPYGIFYVEPDPWEFYRRQIPNFRAPHEEPYIPKAEKPKIEDRFLET